MPRMLPRRYTAGYSSAGEAAVFKELLKQAPDDWVVLHSLDIAPRAGERRRGEADFVVIVPELGAAILEVKTFAREAQHGMWQYSPDGKPSSRSPFDQASGAMGSIRKHLDEQLGRARPFVACGVVTPFGDIVTARKTIEWNEWQAIGQTALGQRGLVQCVTRLLQREAQADGITPWPFDIDKNLDVLRPKFEFFQSPAARRERLSEEVRHYTEEQFDVLDQFEANGQLLVDGPAGTGKTTLALEAARRTALDGKRVLLLCYNRLLADWLTAQVAGLGPNIKADTLHGWLSEILGKDTPPMDGPGYWTEDLPLAAALRVLEDPERHCVDLLVVDEAQDLISPAYLECMSAALRGGITEGTWLFFGDLAKQDVFQRSPSSALGELGRAAGGRVFERPLRRNCRNTRAVAEYAERVGELPPEVRYTSVLRTDLGETPRVRIFRHHEDEPNTLVAELEALFGEGYSAEEIVVLAMCDADSSAAKRVVESGLTPWSDRLKPYSVSHNGHIRYDTIRRFKGLEAPVIVLTDVDECALSSVTTADLVDELLYIGCTRSLDRVSIMCDAKLCARHELR